MNYTKISIIALLFFICTSPALAERAVGCVDTDGFNLSKSGKCTDYTGAHNDACSGSYAREWTCRSGVCVSSLTQCKGSCVMGGICTGQPLIPCKDTDGGDVVSKFGTCTDAKGSFSDACNTDGSITEWNCKDNSCLSRKVFCPDKKVCEKGQCATPPPKCTDSDELNPNLRGTCTDNHGSHTDSCSGGLVREYKCAYNVCVDSLTKCKGTCVEGACIEPLSCKDTDGGDFPDIFGNCTDTKGNFRDGCNADGSIKEWYCSNNACVSHDVSCTIDKVCGGGQCDIYSPETCIDTDSGLNYNKKGVCTDKNGNYLDNCDGLVLSEYSCNNLCTPNKYQCSGSCIDGACGEKCTPEGGILISMPDGGKCCGGLEPMEYISPLSDNCETITQGVRICTACGDGKCGIGENKCNCPTDCDIPSPICLSEGQIGNSFKGDSCCEGLTRVPNSNLIDDICVTPRDGSFVCTYFEDGICGKGENICNSPVDCSETPKCIPEGEGIPLIPNAPKCCEGLTKIQPISPDLVGSAGICTSLCGDGRCNSNIESDYNCPQDCPAIWVPKPGEQCSSTMLHRVACDLKLKPLECVYSPFFGYRWISMADYPSPDWMKCKTPGLISDASLGIKEGRSCENLKGLFGCNVNLELYECKFKGFFPPLFGRYIWQKPLDIDKRCPSAGIFTKDELLPMGNICISQATRCAGTSLEVCNNGQWIAKEAMSTECGAKPVCYEGETRCEGSLLLKCYNGAAWEIVERDSKWCIITPTTTTAK